MYKSYLKFSLTKEEKATFNQAGYIIIKNALDKHQINAYVGLIDRLNQNKDKYFFLDGLPKEDPAFLDMIDFKKVLPKVWDILGWNIFLYHSHLSSTPFCGSNVKSAISWHQDSERVNFETKECEPAPMISIKVAYFLTPTPTPGMGNFHVIPGSHKKNVTPDFNKKVEVCVEAGDACIFDRRLWHAAGVNYSQKTRKAMFFAYSYRWMRPNDKVTDEFLDSIADPIRKQLLGYHGGRDSGYSYYNTGIDNVPLRKWMLEQKIPIAYT